jgi:hypothetical protein
MTLLDPEQIDLVLRRCQWPKGKLAHQALDKILPETAGQDDENDCVLVHAVERSGGERENIIMCFFGSAIEGGGGVDGYQILSYVGVCFRGDRKYQRRLKDYH